MTHAKSTLMLGILLLTAQYSLAQTAPTIDACQAEYNRIQGTPQLARKISEFKEMCSFKNMSAMNREEQFFIKKWGKKICNNLIGDEYNFALQCRYRNLVLRGQLSVAEAMAVAGYTAEYYNYLSPENLQIPPGSSNYEGFDIFNRVLISAVNKLSQFPEFQFNEISYRGASLHGRNYKTSVSAITLNRWNSSSCVKEIAYGPVLIEKSEIEKAKIIAEEGPDAAGLEYLLVDRDPRSIPKKMNLCQKIYFEENPVPPVTPGSHFGGGDLKIIFLPPVTGLSKKIALYSLSTRRNEAEVLIPPGTQFRVIKVLGPDESGGDGINTEVTLQEIAN